MRLFNFSFSRILFTFLFTVLFGSAAFANPVCDGFDNCNSTTYGGAGGKGGKGGDATSIAAAAAVASPTNIQGQQQGIIGSGNSGVKNSGNSTNHITVDPSINTSSASTIAAGAVQDTNNINTENHSDNAGNATVTQNYVAPKIPVATAYAPALAVSPGTCLGSASGGGQGGSFGFSLGFTHTDHTCEQTENAQALASMGSKKAACFRLTLGREGRKNAEAMRLAGFSCDSVVDNASPPAASIVTPEQYKALEDELAAMKERMKRMQAHMVSDK